MILGIMINSISGINIFYETYENLSTTELFTDYNLISSYITANYLFGDKMLKKKTFLIRMREGIQFVFLSDEQYKLIFALITDDEPHLFKIQQKLEHIKYAFITNFIEYCKSFEKNKNHYDLIDRTKIKTVIDPIIDSKKSYGKIEELIKTYGIDFIAKLFSNLLSKKNLIIFGKDKREIEEFILKLPFLVPFREFFVHNKIIPVESIGVLISYIEKIQEKELKDTWCIIGTDMPRNAENKTLTIVDILNKKIINGLDPTVYEYKLIAKLGKIKDTEIMYKTLLEKLEDLINIAKPFTKFRIISEDLLIQKGISPDLIYTITKIINFDFSSEIEIKHTHSYSVIKGMLGL